MLGLDFEHEVESREDLGIYIIITVQYVLKNLVCCCKCTEICLNGRSVDTTQYGSSSCRQVVLLLG